MKHILYFWGIMGLLSCAGTPGSRVNMSQTQTMAGTDTSTHTVDYNALFEGISTRQYTLAALAKTEPDLSTFAGMLEQAGLSEALAEKGPFTLFAPSNQAFADWPQDSVNTLMKSEHRAQLIKLLQGHMLLRELSASELGHQQSVETSGGEYAAITSEEDTVSVGGARIMRSGIKASNGTLHVVDRVITPVESNLDRY